MKALRWATASTRRVVGVLLFAVAGAAIAWGQLPHHVPTKRQAEAEVRRHAQVQSPGQHPTGTPSPLENPRVVVTEVARRYLAAFFTHAGSERHWHAVTDKYSSATLAALNAGLPRREVPVLATRSLRVTGLTDDYAELEAGMSDGSVLFVAVVREAGAWVVNECAPA